MRSREGEEAVGDRDNRERRSGLYSEDDTQRGGSEAERERDEEPIIYAANEKTSAAGGDGRQENLSEGVSVAAIREYVKCVPDAMSERESTNGS